MVRLDLNKTARFQEHLPKIKEKIKWDKKYHRFHFVNL